MTKRITLSTNLKSHPIVLGNINCNDIYVYKYIKDVNAFHAPFNKFLLVVNCYHG